MSKVKATAVEIEDGRVHLEIAYKTYSPEETSDSETFSEIIGGQRNPLTRKQAIEAVIKTAKNWVEGQRGEGVDISAWDKLGHYY